MRLNKHITNKGSIALRAGRADARRCFGRYMHSTMKLLLISAVLFSAFAHATETYQPDWKKVSLTSYGPDSAGDIEIQAEIDESQNLKMAVNSSYGYFPVKETVFQPHLNSLTITKYSDQIDLEPFKHYFVVCLFVGPKKRANFGSVDEPKYEWSYDIATYTFTPNHYTFQVQEHNGSLYVQDCNPKYGM